MDTTKGWCPCQMYQVEHPRLVSRRPSYCFFYWSQAVGEGLNGVIGVFELHSLGGDSVFSPSDLSNFSQASTLYPIAGHRGRRLRLAWRPNSPSIHTGNFCVGDTFLVNSCPTSVLVFFFVFVYSITMCRVCTLCSRPCVARPSLLRGDGMDALLFPTGSGESRRLLARISTGEVFFQCARGGTWGVLSRNDCLLTL